MSITFHESEIPHDKTVLVNVIDDSGNLHTFRFGKDVPRSRIMAVIPTFIKPERNRKRKG